MVDWNKAMELAITAGGSGLASFGGAFLRFKQRLATAETSAAAAHARADAADKKCDTIQKELDEFKRAVESNLKGWRMEFDTFKNEYERDQRHAEELEDVRAEARRSQPNPVESFRYELEQLKQKLERVRDKQGSFVRNETFVEHTKGQEQQWRTLERTLGQLETLVKQM